MAKPTLRIVGHRNFARNLPRHLRPAVHACLRKLAAMDRERWHAAGVRVKKLEGFPYPVFEARLNDGDRLIFTLNRAISGEEQRPRLHIVLWHAGSHDDAVRTAGRRMGLERPAEEDLCELAADADVLGVSWDGLEQLGGRALLAGAPIEDADALVRVDEQEGREQVSSFGPMVEISEADIDRWAESQLDPILHLTPEQRALTRPSGDHAIFLRGGVGTGKTTVLLYRMLKLLLQGAIHNPVLLTYSTSLAAWCQAVFERLPGARDMSVTFTSLRRLLKAEFPQHQTRGGKREFKKEAWNKRKLSGDPDAAWQELRRLRGSAAFQGRQPMTGEELPGSVHDTLRIAYSEYRRHLGNSMDVMDLIWSAYEHYSSPKVSRSLKHDAVFIDEAQDLTPVEWLVCVLMGNRPNLAFFCADEAQDILDTRFTWAGVEAAMKLAGHRAPSFSSEHLLGNRRNSPAISQFLASFARTFELQAEAAHSATHPGPPPLVCVGTPKEMQEVAREAGCPVVLDQTERKDADLGRFLWQLDLDHIKGLEFQVLPVWVPDASWPRNVTDARRLYTALSRAHQVLVVFTGDAVAHKLEAMGARRVRAPELTELLAAHQDLVQADREAVARWKAPSYAQAAQWVERPAERPFCSWKDFRLLIPRWQREAPLAVVRGWVDAELAGWQPCGERVRQWVKQAKPEEAALWVREGLCTREDFAPRLPAWVRNAELAHAVSWVDSGLCVWEDFQSRVGSWSAEATLPLAESWVASGLRTWSDFRERLPGWSAQVNLQLARQWVDEGLCGWSLFCDRLPEWYSLAPAEVAGAWVQQGLCTWDTFRARIPSWASHASFDLASQWVQAGLCHWSQWQGRLGAFAHDVPLEQASEWVAAKLCNWKDFLPRIPAWAARCSVEQAITWLSDGLCEPAALRDRVADWVGLVTFEQASALVAAGVCRWGTFHPRLPEWTALASFEQADAWVRGGLARWKDFDSRIASWVPSATLEHASHWVEQGLCTWPSFADRVAGWTALASFAHAADWVEAGLAQWEDFKPELASWAKSATVQQVSSWREKGLISRQVARAASKGK